MLFAANSFNLPPEIAVQQLEMNLRNYRLYSADNKDDFGNPDHSAAPELKGTRIEGCLLYTSPSPRDATLSRMPSSA